MDYYKFIADEEEIKFFWDYGVPPLKREEIYFFSLSSRNKQLTEEEREYYKVSRSEMFAKQQVRHDSFNELMRHIKRLECRTDGYLTKSGVPYPAKTLVLYFNISPINAYKAMKDQMSYLTEVLCSLSDSAIKNSKGGMDEAFYKVRKSFDTCQSLFARNFGHKEWIDIDVDNKDISENEIDKIKSILRNYFESHDIMLIRTAGGLHCFLRKEKVNVNPNAICEEISKTVNTSEVIQNKNLMCGLPGTWMYGDHIVRVINKEDFIGKIEPFKHGED
jgi:hypothetical protein